MLQSVHGLGIAASDKAGLAIDAQWFLLSRLLHRAVGNCAVGAVASFLFAAAEQEQLKSEIATVMVSLSDLDTEAAEVMGKQQTLQDKHGEQEQVLQEVSERREKQQKEVGAGRPRA
jgi:hypothetical protein